MVEAGRYLWGASSQSPAQIRFMLPVIMFNQVLNSSTTSLDSLCQHLTTLELNIFFSYVLVSFPVLQFVPTFSSPATEHH